MKNKALFALLIILSMLITSVGFADDGEMFRKNVSKTPDLETERANLNHMSFYVPAQAADGTLLEGIEYYKVDGTLLDTRDYAKPLVAVYIDSIEHEAELGSGGAGMGAHDAYAAVSLDDGATWKDTNLSLSADLSSFTLANGTPFPGDAHNMTFAIAGDKVLVGWISKYCDGGSPLYTFTGDQVDALQAEETGFGLPDLYVRDIWGVAGAQRSVDYTLLGFPEVGEIPYSCVWSARGQLLQDPETELFDIVWTKAERLTSGTRDANRLEMNGDSAAGFMMTWQEDPEGLRPGQGLGPGEGWSGAVVNGQTDLWYSFISIEDFDQVDTDGDLATYDPVSLADYTGDNVPKPAVPMAMPIRLTDNKMCKKTGSDPYCYVDFDDVDPYGATVLPDVNWDDPAAVKAAITQTDGVSTLCDTTFTWFNPGGSELQLCVAADGRVLSGRVGASRPRVNVQPYNSAFIDDDADDDGTADDTDWYDSAIVIMGAEESKALGEGMPDDPGGTAGEPTEEELLDIGKNMWYYTFDLLNPQFVMQGGMLNQPAVCTPYDAAAGECTLNEFYPPLYDDFDGDDNPDTHGEYDYEFYETEIARRFSHFSQPIHQFGPSGVSAVLIVKQGIINQGGPADIFLRMTKVDTNELFICDADGDDVAEEQCLPEGYNPYAYENLVCENLDGTSGWEYLPADDARGDPDPNPRYLQGLCTSNMINVSGTSIVACNGVDGDCAADFPWEGSTEEFPKVTEWTQCGPDYDGTFTDCDEEDSTLDDQSWENPYDVAKGHRGFIDGDFIMMMYAWSPNWKANSVGNDHYNLYARRSFDGGQTWTTAPDDYDCVGEDGNVTSCDGTTFTENYCVGITADACEGTILEFGPGEFEQARNLSQLVGNKVTILDPRYSPTGGIKMLPVADKYALSEDLPYDDDAVRDPSKYFIVYETGDNTTVAEGEATPLDLFYSRAYNWGDEYFVVEYPTGDGVGTTDTYEGFDWLEHDREDLSGEAANTANNAGTFYYVIWNQWQEDAEENVSNSDAIFRRVMFLPDDYDGPVPDPEASIVYQSTEMADWDSEDIVLIGSGRAFGTGNAIENYQWWSTIDGHNFNERTWKFPPRGLIPGHHDFSFQVQDNNGNWSAPKTVSIWIAEAFIHTYIPLITR